MKVSSSWLRDYVDTGASVSETADALTMAGLEVETVSDRYAYLDKVVAGRIIEVKPHPDADHLKLCRVDIGEKTLDLVCGAPNAEEGLVVPCALPGMVLPDGSELKETVIRGKKSHGMLCSQVELGLGPDSSGLMALEKDMKPGAKLAECLGLSDHVIEIDLTPNRPDCLGIIGIAREVAALRETQLTMPEISSCGLGGSVLEQAGVRIDSPESCPRYSARALLDIKVGPSPFWLQDKLMSIGLRPINNIVDVTNFVMMESGQPLHAFDLDRISGRKIIVRESEEGELFTTLDNKERRLSRGMLMICDNEKPIALAGVMGGLNSEIDENTKKVLIESACFNPSSIRKTAKKLCLNTDASHRFERGTDPEGTVRALNRAAQLMKEVAGGTLVEGLIDEHPLSRKNKPISLSVSRTNTLLGTALDMDHITRYLESIGFQTEKKDKDSLVVSIPSFRVDVSRQEDLVEEVARLFGYNKIPTTLPSASQGITHSLGAMKQKERIKDLMVGFGFTEAVNYSFINADACEKLRLDQDDFRRSVVKILNPISEDQAVMRSSLVPGLLSTMFRNNSRQEGSVRFFEIGKVFISKKEDLQPEETDMIAGIMTGRRERISWHTKPADCDFYDAKGVVEGLLRALHIENAVFSRLSADQCNYTRPGFAAEIQINGRHLGVLGEVHPQVLSSFDLKQPAFIFELKIKDLMAMVPEIKASRAIPKFPAISRDITLIVDRDLEVSAILDKIKEANEQLVEKIVFFDLYQGDPIPLDKKSVSMRIIYRSMDGTLEDGFINDIHTSISKKLISEFKAMLPV